MESIKGSALTFLKVDSKEVPMSVSKLYFFNTKHQSIPGIYDIRQRIEKNIALHPHLRQRVIEPLFNIANPVWLEDPYFDITYHVNELTLDETSNHDDFSHLITDTTSEVLDRGSPLWKLYFISLKNNEHLFNANFALYFVVHKALELRMQHSILQLLVDNSQNAQKEHHNNTQKLQKSIAEKRKAPIYISTYMPEAFPTRNEMLSKAKDDIMSIPTQFGKISKKIVLFLTRKTIANGITPAQESPPNWFSAPKSIFNHSFGPERVYDSIFLPTDNISQLSMRFKNTTNIDILFLIASLALRTYLDQRNQLPSQSLVALSMLSQGQGVELKRSHYLVRIPTTTKNPMRALRELREQRKLLDDYFKIASPESMLSQLPPKLIGIGSQSYITGRMHRFHRPAFNIFMTYHEQRSASYKALPWQMMNEANYGELYPGIGLHLNFNVNPDQVSINYTTATALVEPKYFKKSFLQAKQVVEQLIQSQPISINSAKAKGLQKQKDTNGLAGKVDQPLLLG